MTAESAARAAAFSEPEKSILTLNSDASGQTRPDSSRAMSADHTYCLVETS